MRTSIVRDFQFNEAFFGKRDRLCFDFEYVLYVYIMNKLFDNNLIRL